MGTAFGQLVSLYLPIYGKWESLLLLAKCISVAHLIAIHTVYLASFQIRVTVFTAETCPFFCFSVCVDDNTRKRKSSEKWGRAGMCERCQVDIERFHHVM